MSSNEDGVRGAEVTTEIPALDHVRSKSDLMQLWRGGCSAFGRLCALVCSLKTERSRRHTVATVHGSEQDRAKSDC